MKMILRFCLLLLPVYMVLNACNDGSISDTLFLRQDPEATGVDFVNQLDYKEEFNIYRYRNFYNGGGVGLSDINNDGLLDIYFTSNMHPNRLYLNKGNFRFEDITEKAGVGGAKAWSTGVSMADVNGDGWVDIYVCNSGDIGGDNKENELFINNGDLTFTERAEEFGIDDRGFSTHAAFFDYDKDGDIDLYLLNNSYEAIGSFDLSRNLRHVRDTVGGDKLYRNDGANFTDVSVRAGIYGSVIGFGLGVTVGDINMDGLEDIYVSNDFFEKDYLYLNNGDGTFNEHLEDMMRSISAASMGADMADINNDRFPEIFVTDMIPEFDDRLKTKTTFDSWDNYWTSVQNDYYHQFTRNMLHLNNGDGTFSEIGRLAGVYATDWSWGALIFDMDNDGKKDLFVANGIYQDLTDQDYLQYFSNREVVMRIVMDKNVDYEKLILAIPSVKISNYAFHNEGDFKFVNRSGEWGLSEPSHSNGSAYGDLDNDGDLDLVVNNVNMTAFVFSNQSVETVPENRFLKFVLKGRGRNTQALGTKITLIRGDEYLYLEQMPVRGFQSSVDPRPNFGLGSMAAVDTVVVEWPDGNTTLLTDVKTNQILELAQPDGNTTLITEVRTNQVQELARSGDSESKVRFKEKAGSKPLFTELNATGIADFRHRENDYIDFNRNKLIFHMLSTQGPPMASGDMDGDGLEDFYIGAAKGYPGMLYLQGPEGTFQPADQPVFEEDRNSEDTDVAIFDADKDGDPDIYVSSGGSEYSSNSSALFDRLYINDGKGSFIKSDQILPNGTFESTSCVKAEDYDQDGDMDLFVGVRLRPFLYGVPVNGYILNNDGKGNFKNITDQVAPGLNEIGMITDMVWSDVDGDNDADLVVVGEWMPVTVFLNEGGRFVNSTTQSGLKGTEGWWNCIASGDFDNDGDVDFVAGNHGWNSRFKASPEKPVYMHVNDFDRNGSTEHIISYYNGDTAYPMALKHDLTGQIPSLKNKYPTYQDYKGQTVEDMFAPEILETSVELAAYELASCVFINDGTGRFEKRPLPVRAQFSPVYTMLADDFNKDGNADLIIGGNLYKAKPEVGRYDASYGLLLEGNGEGAFRTVTPEQSGMRLTGEVRDILRISTATRNLILVGRNHDTMQIFQTD